MSQSFCAREGCGHARSIHRRADSCGLCSCFDYLPAEPPPPATVTSLAADIRAARVELRHALEAKPEHKDYFVRLALARMGAEQ